MIESLTLFLPQLAQLSTGGVGGFLAGYAIKKVVKIIVFFLGLGFLSLLFLSQRGIISIDYEKLIHAISTSLTDVTGFLSTTITFLPLASSFAAGFALGIWKG
ncbi:MAG: FUN14 domain-containing protein [Candidatus Bathyarchaeia archaeon]